MEILQIVGIALIGTLAAILVRQQRPEIAFQIIIATVIILILSVSAGLGGVVNKILQIAGRFNVDADYIGIVIRLIGIAYICQIACEVCNDAGQSAIAANVELGGKILILIYALPVAESLLNMVASILA